MLKVHFRNVLLATGLFGAAFHSALLAAPLPQGLSEMDFPPPAPAQEALGKALMFDKILSGNQDISCATCHHPYLGTSDGLSLPVGAGGMGLGLVRSPENIKARVPRNSPALFNLGAHEYKLFFHDGRLSVDPDAPSGFSSPAGADLPNDMNSALAAQALFPITSPIEMAGQPGDNPIADAAADNDFVRLWGLIVDRLSAIDEYVELFREAFDDVDTAEDIRISHVGNAIAAFEAQAFRCTNSPFDRLTRGGREASDVDPRIKRGAQVFYSGRAQCSSCHSGPLQTDHDFHAIGVPALGPGKNDAFDGRDDYGRERVSGQSEDRYRFRTPSLRQVAMTGPWGHNGTFAELSAMVRHHIDPLQSLTHYDASQTLLPSRDDLDRTDFLLTNDAAYQQTLIDTIDLPKIRLSEREFDDLMVFLEEGLTDPQCLDLRRHVPMRVPSGLPVFD